MKLVGAILIITSAAWVGFRTAYAVQAEVRRLHQLHGALEVMHCEISYKLTPVPELCELVSRTLSGVLSDFFIAVSKRLGMQEEISTRAAFDSVLAGCHGRISPEMTSLLEQLGDILGVYDTQEQLQALQALLEQLRHSLEQLQEGKAARCRSYQVMGVCAGCALVIILI